MSGLRLYVATWYINIFIALNKSGDCKMMSQGSVVKDWSHLESRKPATSHIYEYPVTQEKDNSRI